MKKKTLTMLIVILILAANLPAQDTAANDAYIKAMTANNPNEKAKLLKEWTTQFSGKGNQYENFANAALCIDNYSGKTANDVTTYGEKALSLGGLDDLTKAQVLVNVASVFVNQGQNLSKAKNYANQLIQLANAAKSKEGEQGNAKVWNQMTGAAHFINGQALQKENNLKGAVNAFVSAYNILKNKQIIVTLAQLGQSLYEAKSYADAEAALKVAVPILNDYGATTLYAKALHRNGKNADALKYYKQSYSIKKAGEIAYNIGILMAPGAKSNPTAAQETIQFLLEASFLSPANSAKAMELAQGLYFGQNPEYNSKVRTLQSKSNSMTELTKSFNSKFGEKTEEDLTDAEKKEMDSILNQIKTHESEIATLQGEVNGILEAWNQKIAQVKAALGIQ